MTQINISSLICPTARAGAYTSALSTAASERTKYATPTATSRVTSTLPESRPRIPAATANGASTDIAITATVSGPGE